MRTQKPLFLTLFFLLLTAGMFTACSSDDTSVRYSAEKHLETGERAMFIDGIIRYMGKIPPKSNHQTKFDEQYDDYYLDLAGRYSLDLYHNDEQTGTYWFMASRVAPSLHYRRVGVAGRVVRDEHGDITMYEEVFRTWKMPEDVLREKGGMLFVKMLNGDDLTPYYSENSGDEEYIEFPDASVHFDVERRMWVIRNDDSVQVSFSPVTTILQE